MGWLFDLVGPSIAPSYYGWRWAEDLYARMVSAENWAEVGRAKISEKVFHINEMSSTHTRSYTYVDGFTRHGSYPALSPPSGTL